MILLVMSAGIQAPPGIQDGLSPSFFRRLRKKERRLHSYNTDTGSSTDQYNSILIYLWTSQCY